MKKIFIIHGWTYALDKWDEVCRDLRAHDVEPVLLKVPGLTTPSSKIWDIDGYVEWLNGELKGEAHPTVHRPQQRRTDRAELRAEVSGSAATTHPDRQRRRGT